MNYRVFKRNNFVIVIDEENKYFESECNSVIISKHPTESDVYTIAFYRPGATPQNFYNLSFTQILDEFYANYPSQADWETWYTLNTGESCGANNGGGGSGPSTNVSVVPIIEQITTGITGQIHSKVFSISFASNGTAAALVSFDGGNTYTALEPGTIVNMDAGSVLNYYETDTFFFDTLTNTGAALLISYNLA